MVPRSMATSAQGGFRRAAATHRPGTTRRTSAALTIPPSGQGPRQQRKQILKCRRHSDFPPLLSPSIALDDTMAFASTPRAVSRQLTCQLARCLTRSSQGPRHSLLARPSHLHPSTATTSRRTLATTSTSPHHSAAISVIRTDVDPTSDEFLANAQQMGEAVSQIEGLTRRVQEGGPLKAREKHRARGKMLPRQRVRELIDPGTTFLELSPLAGHELYPEADVPSGGIITGVGVVEGVTCVIVANDSTVKGGTYYPITVKKHLRAQEVAEQNNLP